MSDEEEVKITPTVHKKRSVKRGGKHRPSQKDRVAQRVAELKKLNIHRPLGKPSPADVKAIKDLKDMLKNTWHTLWEEVDKFQRFTPKQMRFAKQYALNGRSNIIGAMREAGYESPTPHVLWTMGRKNLRLGYFENMIQAFELEAKAAMKMNVEDVVQWFNTIATKALEEGDYTNANRAMENLAKWLGMFVEKREITHTVIHSKAELDQKIIELTAVLKEAEPEIEERLRLA